MNNIDYHKIDSTSGDFTESQEPNDSEVCVALGSNLGDRLENIYRGVKFLNTFHTGKQPLLVSSVYETEPVDCPAASPRFLNAVCVLTCSIDPEVLLKEIKQFEQSVGRNLQARRNSPRPLDMDIIYYGSYVCRSPHLTLPHPRAHQRKFVLAPLAELRPYLCLPGHEKTVLQLLDTVATAEIICRVKS